MINICRRNGIDLFLGCDAKAHCRIWGLMDGNQRGEELLEYILAKDFEMLNEGTESTFVTANRFEDLCIMCSQQIQTRVKV